MIDAPIPIPTNLNFLFFFEVSKIFDFPIFLIKIDRPTLGKCQDVSVIRNGTLTCGVKPYRRVYNKGIVRHHVRSPNLCCQTLRNVAFIIDASMVRRRIYDKFQVGLFKIFYYFAHVFVVVLISHNYLYVLYTMRRQDARQSLLCLYEEV